ncbi:hypothetical protein [Fibrella forsythiae]|uniref:Uncharacterized protein n=1 Tax=Fibrella forsythiae TaxID=2817061 RepID=A0ABS3JJ35_9BACT|nr:hypothetical protein [Fibrella forsythiae]MBO0950021.1 hypothetical protein [Fibrella forsythiae]
MVIHPPNRAILVFTAILLLIGSEALVVRSAVFARAPALLSLAVLFDLTVVSSALFYWLLARPKGWSIGRTGLIALFMLRIGLFILPANTQLTLVDGPVLLALAEAAALLLIMVRIRTIRQTYLTLRPTTSADQALHLSLAVVFGQRAAGVILSEWQLVRYVTVGWRQQSDIPATALPLTTHRESGQVALTVALGVVCLIELMGMHLLVARWSPDMAFWLTLASAYSLLLVVADVVATIRRPSYKTADALQLRLGIRWQATISLSQIAAIVSIHEKPVRQNGLLNMALLTEPNVLLTLNAPICVNGPYGIRREATQLALWIDGGISALS